MPVYHPESEIPADVLVHEVLTFLQESASQKNISFEMNIPGDLKLTADRNMLKTVIQNLLSNALKFSYPGGKVVIAAEKKRDEVCFKIRDQGTGMPPAIVEKLFRIDQGITMPGTANELGTGLGLIICREFIKKHGGKISVQSESDRGSEFSFSIPQ
jgi:signal transduction histidine kinase